MQGPNITARIGAYRQGCSAGTSCSIPHVRLLLSARVSSSCSGFKKITALCQMRFTCMPLTQPHFLTCQGCKVFMLGILAHKVPAGSGCKRLHAQGIDP